VTGLILLLLEIWWWHLALFLLCHPVLKYYFLPKLLFSLLEKAALHFQLQGTFAHILFFLLPLALFFLVTIHITKLVIPERLY
jgi:hypothetical protein